MLRYARPETPMRSILEGLAALAAATWSGSLAVRLTTPGMAADFIIIIAMWLAIAATLWISRQIWP